MKAQIYMAQKLECIDTRAPRGGVWLVLCNKREVQIFEKCEETSQYTALFDAPLNAKQLQHEIEWHYRSDTKSIAHGNILDGVSFLLEIAYQRHLYNSLTLVAPLMVGTILKRKLSASVLRAITHSIKKDLTHCPKEAILSYFAHL